jgi:hypothetical protein
MRYVPWFGYVPMYVHCVDNGRNIYICTYSDVPGFGMDGVYFACVADVKIHRRSVWIGGSVRGVTMSAWTYVRLYVQLNYVPICPVHVPFAMYVYSMLRRWRMRGNVLAHCGNVRTVILPIHIRIRINGFVSLRMYSFKCHMYVLCTCIRLVD